MNRRILLLTLFFLAGSAYIARASRTEPTPPREPLAQLNRQIGTWRGRDFDIEERVLRVLGVDDYLNRSYSSPDSLAFLYVGYYQSQRQGSTMHSPMNCLPGAGWNPVTRSHMQIAVSPEPGAPAQTIEVNRIVIEKGLERQMALYWYQAHGRVIASEYWGKIYTVLDAMHLNRTDGSLVRIITPIPASGADAEKAAENVAVKFVQSIFPLLSRHLPE
jgi:EpsI family protein